MRRQHTSRVRDIRHMGVVSEHRPHVAHVTVSGKSDMSVAPRRDDDVDVSSMPWSWDACLSGYALWARAEGHRPDSVRTRLSYLRRFGNEHPDGPRVTGAQLCAWVGAQSWGAATLKSAQGALRSFYTYAMHAGIVDSDPCCMLGKVKVPERLPRPAGDHVDTAYRYIVDPDVRLMVMLALKAGLRRTEIATVRRSDLVGDGLRIVGKGGKERLVGPLHPDIVAMIRVKGPGYVFPAEFGGNSGRARAYSDASKHLHPDTVASRIMDAVGTSPHPLRHRFATKAYKGSNDIFSVQQLLGHSSPETTMIYTKIDTDQHAAAMAAAWAD